MQIEIRGDKVIIDGYVNAVGRDSRPIRCQTGDFVEQVEPGVFRKALSRAKNIDLLLNHRQDRKLGSTEDGVLTLSEDNIGLRAHAEVGDEEVIQKARKNLLSGWSFGMYVNECEMEQRSNAVPRRKLKDIDMFEVSIIDNTMLPCYAGTSVECRAEGENTLLETRAFEDTVEVNEIIPDEYYSEREKQLEQLRTESQWLDAEKRLQELRYNPYHDPKNGRFTSGTGGGEYIFMVPKGKAKEGILVKDIGIGDKDAANFYYNAVYQNSNINNGKHHLVNGNKNFNSSSPADLSSGDRFGVSGGAGTAYTLVQTENGNRLVRNDYLIEKSDGRLLISTRSTATAREGAKSGIDYSKSPHSAIPESIADVKPGKPMSFNEADNGNANPNYSPLSYGYSHNCQSCVVTHEARIRGFDVETKPKTSAVAKELSRDTTLAWIDPKTGSKPKLEALTGNKGVELDRIIKNGERYSIQYEHNRGGHIITASRDDKGNIRLYDPQTNKKVTGKREINDYFSSHNARNVKFVRVDNLDFNEDVANAIMKKSKKKKR